MTYVYVMQGADGRTKVGISQNPQSRRRAVEIAESVAHTIVYQKHVGSIVLGVERGAHRLLKERGFHSSGEYFTASPDECICAVEEAIASIGHDAISPYEAKLLETPNGDLSVAEMVDKIGAWLRATGMAEARLGLLACANVRAVKRVRAYKAQMNTLEAILDYIDQHPARGGGE